MLKRNGDANAVQQAVAMLAQARRPLLLAGGGIIDSEASQEAVELAEVQVWPWCRPTATTTPCAAQSGYKGQPSL